MQLDENDILDEKPNARRKVVRREMPEISPMISSKSVPKETIVASAPSAAKKLWISILDQAFNWIVCGTIFLLPLFYLPLGIDVLELHKQTLLFVSTFFLAICYALHGMLSGSFTRRSSLIFVGIGAWLIAWLAASIFSFYPFNSLLGIEKQEMMSFATVAAYGIFIFLIAQRFTIRDASRGLFALYLSMAVTSIIGILQLRGIYILPDALTHTPSFNPLGQYDIWGVACAVTLVAALIHIIALSLQKTPPKNIVSALLAGFAGFMIISLVLLNDWRLWIGVIAGLLLSLATLLKKLPHEYRVGWILLPGFVLVFAVTMAAFQPKTIQLPLVAQPTWATSAAIASETLLKYPLFGTGPGNFISAYTEFRPKDMNKANYLQLWTTRFDQSSAYIFTLATTGGIVGIIGLILFFFILLSQGISELMRREFDAHAALLLTTLAAFVTLSIELLWKPANITLVGIAALLVALIVVCTAKSRTVISNATHRFMIASSLIVSIGVCLGIVGALNLGKRYIAEVAFADALKIDERLGNAQSAGAPAQKDIDALIDALVRASTNNPLHATYVRLLSQGLNYRLTALASSQDFSKPEIQQQAQTLTGQAVDTAKRALDLAPHDVRNAENLALIYQNVSPLVSGAEDFVLKTYGKASELDPSNPAHHLNIAKFFLTQAAIHSQRAETKKTDAEKGEEKQLASKALEGVDPEIQKALKLKEDYAAAYYYSALLKLQQEAKEESAAALEKAFNANMSLANQGSYDAGLFVNIALAYEALGTKDKAEDALKAALAIQPEAPGALWQYALLLADKGQKNDAISILNRLAKNEPTNTTIQDKIKELQGLAPKKETEKESASVPIVPAPVTPPVTPAPETPTQAPTTPPAPPAEPKK